MLDLQCYPLNTIREVRVTNNDQIIVVFSYGKVIKSDNYQT